MQREIANVAAACRLRAFRYTTFPPVVFEPPQREPEVQVMSAPEGVPVRAPHALLPVRQGEEPVLAAVPERALLPKPPAPAPVVAELPEPVPVAVLPAPPPPPPPPVTVVPESPAPLPVAILLEPGSAPPQRVAPAAAVLPVAPPPVAPPPAAPLPETARQGPGAPARPRPPRRSFAMLTEVAGEVARPGPPSTDRPH